jgi:hypothetical protein
MISTKRINVLRLILVFTALVLSINFISRIIGAKFDFVHFLNWETLIFEIGVEGILLILCALITYFGTWFIKGVFFLEGHSAGYCLCLELHFTFLCLHAVPGGMGVS